MLGDPSVVSTVAFARSSGGVCGRHSSRKATIVADPRRLGGVDHWVGRGTRRISKRATLVAILDNVVLFVDNNVLLDDGYNRGNPDRGLPAD